MSRPCTVGGVGRARACLVDSAQSFPTRSEDRLTELVATVANACPPLCAALLSSLHLPVGDRFVVETQVRVAGTPNVLHPGELHAGVVLTRVLDSPATPLEATRELARPHLAALEPDPVPAHTAHPAAVAGHNV
jgi:hypothetical protein